MAWTTVPGVGKLRSSVLSALIGEVRPITARKTTDEIVSSSISLQNDDELLVAAAANARYKFEMFILYQAGTTADYKWALTYPAGATISGIVVHQYTTALAWTQALSGAYASGTAVAAGGNGIGTAIALIGTGFLVMSTTAGNLQYQWCQNTTTVENTTTMAGSGLLLFRAD